MTRRTSTIMRRVTIFERRERERTTIVGFGFGPYGDTCERGEGRGGEGRGGEGRGGEGRGGEGRGGERDG